MGMARVAGRGFFPGACGLFEAKRGQPWPRLPDRGVMVLGHNYDSVRNFERFVAAGEESLAVPTWRELVSLLPAVGIAPDECFFTNFFIGLIPAESGVGVFPGAGNSEFVGRCLAFLGRQLEIVRPRLVLVLGRHVPPKLAPLVPAWRGLTSLGAIDARDAALQAIEFGGRWVVFAVLTHPSLRPANVPRRRFRGISGDEAERALIREAMRIAGLLQAKR
jgi:hypothetical protein